MIEKKYLLDTHALYCWAVQERVSTNFIDFFYKQSVEGNVYISSVSIWEIGLLIKKRTQFAWHQIHLYYHLPFILPLLFFYKM